MSETTNLSSFEPFVARRFLRNRHLMTLAGNFLPRQSSLPEPEECFFHVAHDVQVLCHCHWQPDAAEKPAIIIVHGLEGSSSSQYVIGTGSKAWQAGMSVVRMNMRTCGGTERLAPTLYHSGLSGDVGAVLNAAIADKKLKRVGLVGYSMGGNLVLKLAGELGSGALPELKAVAAVSPAADLAASADAMHDWSNRIYEWKFLLGLMRRFNRKSELFPDIYKKASQWPSSIRKFDHVITAPYSGFSSADDYYTRAAAARVIDKIAVPTLLIHAADDPFIRLLPPTREKIRANPNVTLLETSHGGHCAFLASPNGYDGRWAERQIIRFFCGRGMGMPSVAER
jgi:predicted alpha/beta-fold hydrolase